MKSKNIAVVLAGGLGLRMGGECPKQLLEIEGKPIVIHSLEVFDNHPLIDDVVLVVNAKFQEDFQVLLKKYALSKLKKIIEGGKERSDSSRNAIAFFKDEISTANILIHDAVRPFVSEKIITDVILALDTYNAVNVGVPAVDTVLIADEKRHITVIPERKNVFLAQTPQGFKLGLIRDAYEKAERDKSFRATDDCGVVHRYFPEVLIGIVEGDIKNRKITFPSDLSQ